MTSPWVGSQPLMPRGPAMQGPNDPEQPEGSEELDELTGMLADLGDRDRQDELFALVYERLMAVATRLFHGERANHTLQPTALVHEAWMRLSAERGSQWKNRAQFFAVGATVMRRILVDHARSKQRAKRGGDVQVVPLELDQASIGEANEGDDLLDIDQALTKLAELDPRQARIIELRFFSGLTVPEVASCLGASTRTVEAEWTVAKAWLRRELARGAEG